MVFNPSILNESVNTTPTLESMVGSVGEYSYFSQTVDFLIESNREYNQITKNLYKSIYEAAGDQEVINESFADFGTAVKKIIDKFIAFIKSIFERFITNLNSLVKNEKHLKKHKDAFKKFSKVHEFTFNGYEFTLFNSNIPHADAESEWVDGVGIDTDFSKYAEEFKKNSGTDHLETLRKVQTDIEEKMEENYKKLIDRLENGYYDELRGRIIDVDYSISESDFAKELFAIFRNGTSDTASIEVDSSYIIDAYKRFDDYEDIKKSINNTKTRIENEYKSIKSSLEKMVKTNGSAKDNTLSLSLGYRDIDDVTINSANNAMLTQMELYKKAKVNQVQQMSNIHALAFAAKLDAAKDMFNQDKAVLYKALYRVQGLKKEDTK